MPPPVRKVFEDQSEISQVLFLSRRSGLGLGSFAQARLIPREKQPARASSDDLLLLQESPVRVSIHSEFRQFLRLSALKLAKYSTTVERRLHLALASVQERLMSVLAASIYRQGGDSCFCNVSLKPHIPKPKYCWVRLRN